MGKHISTLGLALGAVIAAGAWAGAASANTYTLYGTQGDFGGTDGTSAFTGGGSYKNSGGTTVTIDTVSAVSSSEGTTTNGILATSPGSAGTPGAIQITFANGFGGGGGTGGISTNYAVVASTSYQNFGTFTGTGATGTLAPSALVNALDSGGTITLKYTVPAGTTYLNPPLFLINAPNNYDQLSGTASASADSNGFYTDTISLAGLNNIASAEQASEQTNGYGYLTFGIIYNAELPSGAVSEVSDIAVNTPEPASIGLFGLGAAGLLLLGRKRLTR